MASSDAVLHAPRLPRWIETLARLGALACLIALPLLSLLPADVVERTGAGKNLEHAIAYAGTGLLLTLGIAAPRHRLIATLLLIALAATLESAQGFTATRSAELAQFIAGSLGALIGLVAGSLARHPLAR
ncbi:hypothetical protein [Ancylobacter sp. SL191]|uniref:hypothetical protein n=1 Tax=Ancylobacter sp. SL191 TaxID=2995166 RepID=UPI0022713EBB|nr:hypothetical protein [Ancylobacter sp. SL191]WAC26129.1 hypothetical protein OU996_14040 [Ancylobacter sp. SL191]